MSERTFTESLLRSDRLLVALCMALLCLLSWYYLLTGAGTGMSTLAMTTWDFPPPVRHSAGGGRWSAEYWLVMLAMWWVMMIAMMIPSATPVVLLYARVHRHNSGGGGPVPTLSFLSGYLVAWLAFSLAATAMHWALERTGLVHGMLMWSTSRALTGGFLVAAGLYQLSPLKNACLAHCRSPAQFLSGHWRAGAGGALRMGVDHGLYCIGCCWVLMLLLFAGGTMNLVWIAGLTLLVLAEKVLPAGRTVALTAGAGMILAGLLVMFG